jgi:hypothetical protein
MRCESLYVCGKRGGFTVNGELSWLIPEVGHLLPSNYKLHFRPRQESASKATGSEKFKEGQSQLQDLIFLTFVASGTSA